MLSETKGAAEVSCARAEADEQLACNQKIIEAAYAGHDKEVLDFCIANPDFSNTTGTLCNKVFTVNILGAAILGGHFKLVNALVKAGFDVNIVNNFCTPTAVSSTVQNTSRVPIEISPIMLVFCLGDSKASDNWKIKPNSVAAQVILRFLIKNSLEVTSEDLAIGLEFFRADPKEILFIITTVKEGLDGNVFPLELAVNTGSLALVQEALLLEDVDLESYFEPDEDFLDFVPTHDVEPGSTPLIVAVAKGNQPMVELLLRHNAPIEQEFCASDYGLGINTICRRVHRFEGYTPLLMAVEYGHEPVVKELLEKGANVLHRSATGKTAISIATEKKGEAGKERAYESILSLLVSRIPKPAAAISAHEALMNLQTEQTLIESAKIQENFTRLIFTGKKDGKRCFLIFCGLGTEANLSLFLLSIPTRNAKGLSVRDGLSSWEKVYKEITIDLGKYTGFDFEFEKIGWKRLPILSCYIPEHEIYYEDNIVVCELDDLKKIEEKILTDQDSDFKFQLVTSSDLMRNSNIQNLWLPKITAALLACIDKMLESNDADLGKEEYEQLKLCYYNTLCTQHQVLSAAKTGNIAQLETLLQQGAVFWHNAPSLASMNEKDLRLRPLQQALEYKQWDCAIYILNKLPADSLSGLALAKLVPGKQITEIIKDGHLALYKALHERQHELTVFSIAPVWVSTFLDNAHTMGHHQSLMEYIGDSINPNSRNDLIAMLQAADSKQFDEALRLFKVLQKALQPFDCRHFVSVIAIYQSICTGHFEFYEATSSMEIDSIACWYLDTAISYKQDGIKDHIVNTLQLRLKKDVLLRLQDEANRSNRSEALVFLSNLFTIQNIIENIHYSHVENKSSENYFPKIEPKTEKVANMVPVKKKKKKKEKQIFPSQNSVKHQQETQSTSEEPRFECVLRLRIAILNNMLSKLSEIEGLQKGIVREIADSTAIFKQPFKTRRQNNSRLPVLTLNLKYLDDLEKDVQKLGEGKPINEKNKIIADFLKRLNTFEQSETVNDDMKKALDMDWKLIEKMNEDFSTFHKVWFELHRHLKTRVDIERLKSTSQKLVIIKEESKSGLPTDKIAEIKNKADEINTQLQVLRKTLGMLEDKTDVSPPRTMGSRSQTAGLAFLSPQAQQGHAVLIVPEESKITSELLENVSTKPPGRHLSPEEYRQWKKRAYLNKCAQRQRIEREAQLEKVKSGEITFLRPAQKAKIAMEQSLVFSAELVNLGRGIEKLESLITTVITTEQAQTKSAQYAILQRVAYMNAFIAKKYWGESVTNIARTLRNFIYLDHTVILGVLRFDGNSLITMMQAWVGFLKSDIARKTQKKQEDSFLDNEGTVLMKINSPLFHAVYEEAKKILNISDVEKNMILFQEMLDFYEKQQYRRACSLRLVVATSNIDNFSDAIKKGHEIIIAKKQNALEQNAFVVHCLDKQRCAIAEFDCDGDLNDFLSCLTNNNKIVDSDSILDKDDALFQELYDRIYATVLLKKGCVRSGEDIISEQAQEFYWAVTHKLCTALRLEAAQNPRIPVFLKDPRIQFLWMHRKEHRAMAVRLRHPDSPEGQPRRITRAKYQISRI